MDTRRKDYYGWSKDEPEGWSYRTGERDRPRIGWSLALAVLAQIIIAGVAAGSGATAVGVMATAAIAVCNVMLVGAEIIRRLWP